MTTVIALIGPAGCGKTSLIRSLVQSSLDASPLFSDTYKSVAIWAPHYKHLQLSDEEAAQKWFEEGCPADDYCSIPQLIKDLESLCAGRSIATPVPMPEGGEHEIKAARYILLEDTWSCRTELKHLVDYRIQISVPFDIALARFVQRDFGQGRDLSEWAARYLKQGFKYVRAVDKLKEQADLVVDGLKPTRELTDEIITWIRENIEQSIEPTRRSAWLTGDVSNQI